MAAQITLEEAVAGKGSPEVKKAAAAAVDTATQGYQEGIVPKVPMTPTILEQIMGGEDIVLTVIATITLVLGIVVTAGAGYVTFTSWQARPPPPQKKNPIHRMATDFRLTEWFCLVFSFAWGSSGRSVQK